MKYFVTGGAGFIGSELVKRLLMKNHKVTVFDNFSLGNRKFLDTKNPNLKIIKGDITNIRKVETSIKNHDFVYHLAANSDIPAGIKNSKLDFEINTIGTLNILNSMVKYNVQNIVFASSSAVFGFPTKFPTSEDYGPCLPESFYGASKLAAEGYISSFSNLHGIKSWIFRFANITGSPGTHGIIFDFMKKLDNPTKKFEVLGNGLQEKSYITNKMLIDAILKIIQKTKKNKQKIFLYNIGNNDTIKIKDIAKMFLNEHNSEKKITYTGGKGGWKGDVHKMSLDISKIKNEGWSPKKNSKQCISESIKNYWN
jgi:UDP-glucose 4-epimerase